AIADENHHAANDVGLVARRARRMVQLFRTSFIDGVVDRRAAARARSHDLVAQRSRIAGKALDDLRFVIEGHDERFIFVAAQHAEKKADRSILLEFDAVANAVRSVEQHADAQRQIRLFAEIADFLRLAYIEDLEIALLQIRNQFIAAVEDGEEDIDEVDFDCEGLAGLRGRLLVWSWRGGSLRLRVSRGLLRQPRGRGKEKSRSQKSGDKYFCLIHRC